MNRTAIATESYEAYWAAVIGDRRSAEDAVREFDLMEDRRGLSEWLGEGEEEARRQGAHIDDGGDNHARALDELLAAIAERDADASTLPAS